MSLASTSWLDKLQVEERLPEIVRDTGVMGWRYTDGALTAFAYGARLYHVDGRVTQLITKETNSALNKWYLPTGKKSTWLRAARLLTDRKRPELDVIIAAAFAAPLTVFAGALYGPVLTIWGEPGTSKSTAQAVAAAVWGHPVQTRESVSSSDKSVQYRLGRVRNLAVYWDDIQNPKHFQMLSKCIFVASEGAEGGRLTGNGVFVERGQWQTILVVCANASLVKYLTSKQGRDLTRGINARLRRVFEFGYHQTRKAADEPGMIDPLEASRIFASLNHNYGLVGAEYAALLAREHARINDLVATVIRRFTERVKGKATGEAFWIGLCGTLIAGAMLARELGVGLDAEAMETFLAGRFVVNRAARYYAGSDEGEYECTERALIGFFNACVAARNAIVTPRLPGVGAEACELIGMHVVPLVRPVVMHVVRRPKLIMFNYTAFHQWADAQSYPWRVVRDGLVKFFDVKITTQRLGGGTAFSVEKGTGAKLFVKDDTSAFWPYISGQAFPDYKTLRQGDEFHRISHARGLTGASDLESPSVLDSAPPLPDLP